MDVLRTAPQPAHAPADAPETVAAVPAPMDFFLLPPQQSVRGTDAGVPTNPTTQAAFPAAARMQTEPRALRIAAAISTTVSRPSFTQRAAFIGAGLLVALPAQASPLTAVEIAIPYVGIFSALLIGAAAAIRHFGGVFRKIPDAKRENSQEESAPAAVNPEIVKIRGDLRKRSPNQEFYNQALLGFAEKQFAKLSLDDVIYLIQNTRIETNYHNNHPFDTKAFAVRKKLVEMVLNDPGRDLNPEAFRRLASAPFSYIETDADHHKDQKTTGPNQSHQSWETITPSEKRTLMNFLNRHISIEKEIPFWLWDKTEAVIRKNASRWSCDEIFSLVDFAGRYGELCHTEVGYGDTYAKQLRWNDFHRERTTSLYRFLATTRRWTYQEMLALAKRCCHGSDVKKEIETLAQKRFLEDVELPDPAPAAPVPQDASDIEDALYGTASLALDDEAKAELLVKLVDRIFALQDPEARRRHLIALATKDLGPNLFLSLHDTAKALPALERLSEHAKSPDAAVRADVQFALDGLRESPRYRDRMATRATTAAPNPAAVAAHAQKAGALARTR